MLRRRARRLSGAFGIPGERERERDKKEIQGLQGCVPGILYGLISETPIWELPAGFSALTAMAHALLKTYGKRQAKPRQHDLLASSLHPASRAKARQPPSPAPLEVHLQAGLGLKGNTHRVQVPNN